MTRKRRSLPISIIPIGGMPIIKEGDDLAKLICNSLEKQETSILDGDIIVITHVVVSRAEGDIIDLDSVSPSKVAENIAIQYDRDPRLVEVVLRESKNIIRMGGGHIISETKHGFICANAGVDVSNVPGVRNVVPLPINPDGSAQKIRQRIKDFSGKDVAVIISDTHGRALRNGEINVALGVAGIEPVLDRRGEPDLFGYILKVKRTAVADELSSAAELVIGQSNEGIPAALIRGYQYEKSDEGDSSFLVRRRENSLFF